MSSTIALLIGLAAGLLLGCLLGWLAGRNRSVPSDGRLENELRQQLTQRDTDLAGARTQLIEVGNAAATALAAKTAAENSLLEQRQARDHLQAEVSALRDSAAQIGADLATAKAQLAAERTALLQLAKKHEEAEKAITQMQEQLLSTRQANGSLEARANALDEKLQKERQQMEHIQQKFQSEFEAISNKILVENSARFNQQSGENLEKLLMPLKENLSEFKAKLETAHRDASANSALLKDQIGRIGTEAANLSKALKGDVKALGNWGENMLDQILEKSGLQNGVHYRRQQGAKDTEGEQRFLDVIIELPDKKHLIIDSKVSLKNYEEHVNAPDETSRSTHLESHVESIRSHFRGLGAKRYQDIHGINAPDFVLMYVPIEAAFFVALAHEPGLFAEALDKNVVLITNSTLLATLRTVASVWRLADQQKNALEIADRGGKLYDKFVGFIKDLQDVGSALATSQQAWEAATNKLHKGAGNLVTQAEKLKTLGAKATKAIPSESLDKAADFHPGLLPPAA